MRRRGHGHAHPRTARRRAGGGDEVGHKRRSGDLVVCSRVGVTSTEKNWRRACDPLGRKDWHSEMEVSCTSTSSRDGVFPVLVLVVEVYSTFCCSMVWVCWFALARLARYTQSSQIERAQPRPRKLRSIAQDWWAIFLTWPFSMLSTQS